MVENFNDLQGVCLKVFESISGICTVFILPLFMAKIIYSSVLGEGSKAFSIIKGVVVYFVLTAAFPLILELILSIPESFLPKYKDLDNYIAGAKTISVGTSAVPSILDKVIEAILAGLYWIVYYLHIFFIILMSSMAPVVFLLSSILGIGLGLEAFFGLLLIGSSWPLIWYGFDQVHVSLASAQDDAFGAKCLELLITLLKGIGPISFAALAIKSPAGRAISQSAGFALMRSRATAGFAKSSISRVVSRSESKSVQKPVSFDRRLSNSRGIEFRSKMKSQISNPSILRERARTKKGTAGKNENSLQRNS